MIDRALGIVGVAISILTGFAQWLWPDIPPWLAAVGFTLGAILIVVAVVLLLRSVFRGKPKEAISGAPPPSQGGSGVTRGWLEAAPLSVEPAEMLARLVLAKAAMEAALK